jgi:peptide deformylase
MSVLQIITVPDPILRKKAHKVTDFGKDFQKLVADMIETLRDAPGVGLAAPQVGILQQLIVVEYGDDDDESVPKKLFVVANPEIIQTSDTVVEGLEGCLSIPDLVGNVERFESVVIKGFNRQGKPVKIKAEDWLARIFQHEIDHLSGVLYTDRADKVWKPQNEDEEQAMSD